MGTIVIIIILILIYKQAKSIFRDKAKLARTIIVLLLLIFISSSSYALSEFAGVFTLINPSAINVAFGLESGTANIWDRNPLDVWSNPAKLGYYKGFSYGYSKNKWFEDVVENMYHNSSYITFGWNGLGVLLPFKNKYKKYGTTMYYGEQEAYDAYGNYLMKFNSYETCSQFAVGINCFEFADNFFNLNPEVIKFQRYSEISYGYSLDYIVSGLCPLIPELMDAAGEGKSLSHNVGSLIKMNLSQIFYDTFKFDNLLENIQNDFSFNDILSFEVAGGINFINISKSEILYENSENKIALPYGNGTAIAGKLSFINLNNILPPQLSLICFFNNIFSIYASYDNAKYGDNPSTWGKGIEYTFLDLFSWRFGEYYNIDGHLVGKCKGQGINIHYKDIVSLQYNYVEFPGGELVGKQKKKDMSFNIDIIKLINALE